MFNAKEHAQGGFKMARDIVTKSDIDEEMKTSLIGDLAEAEEEIMDPMDFDIEEEPEIKIRMYILHVISSTCETVGRAYEIQKMAGEMFE